MNVDVMMCGVVVEPMETETRKQWGIMSVEHTVMIKAFDNTKLLYE